MKKYLPLILCPLTLVLTQCSSDEVAPPMGILNLSDSRPAALMGTAKAKEAKGQLGAAIKDYEKITKYHPVSLEAAPAQFRTAELYTATKDVENAFDAYQNFITRYPSDSRYRAALQGQKELAFGAVYGKLYNHVFGLWKVKVSSIKVTEWLDTLVNNAPYANTAAESLNLLGDYLSRNGHYAQAIQTFDKLVKDYPSSPFAPVAQLKIADLYAGNHKAGERAHINIVKAQEAYESFLLDYPNSSKANDASRGLANVRADLVAEKLKIGEYYQQKMHDNSAAVFCYQDVVNNAKFNPKAAAKAQSHLRRMGVK